MGYGKDEEVVDLTLMLPDIVHNFKISKPVCAVAASGQGLLKKLILQNQDFLKVFSV